MRPSSPFQEPCQHTHLLNAGYPLSTITGARASGAVCEIGSTFIYSWAVGTLSASDHSPGWYDASWLFEGKVSKYRVDPRT